MITLQSLGVYKLIETRRHNKILYLDNYTYAWVEAPNIGEILVTSHKVHKTDCVLSLGRYRLYDVQNEPRLTDQIHLELETGRKQWQGYLLLTGLPDSQKKRGRIIPTEEVITANPRFETREELQQIIAMLVDKYD